MYQRHSTQWTIYSAFHGADFWLIAKHNREMLGKPIREYKKGCFVYLLTAIINESTEDLFNTHLLFPSSFKHRMPLASCSPFIFKLTFNENDINLNFANI